MGIPILLNEDLNQYGINEYCVWEPETAPHAIISGPTDSGKTYFAKLFLAKIALYEKNPEIYICDFKGFDFSRFHDCKYFFRYNDCMDGLNQFYNHFIARLQGEDDSRNMLVLYFDEWASYLNHLEKKTAEEEKKKLSNMLMMSRAYRINIICSQQRSDAQYFSTARDNFSLIISLGNISNESKEMLFRDYKNEIKPDRKQGTGYLLTNGANLQKVIVPKISDTDKLHDTIKKAVN